MRSRQIDTHQCDLIFRHDLGKARRYPLRLRCVLNSSQINRQKFQKTLRSGSLRLSRTCGDERPVGTLTGNGLYPFPHRGRRTVNGLLPCLCQDYAGFGGVDGRGTHQGRHAPLEQGGQAGEEHAD